MAYGQSLAREIRMTKRPDVPHVQPLLDAIGLLEKLGIGYALVGGLAAMYYGRPRFTEDVDLVAASGHAGQLAAHPDLMRQYHFDPTCTYKLYHESGVDIDLWKDEHVEGILARAVEVPMAGRRVRLAEMHDLLAMKLRAGRFQDDYDIAEMLKHQRIDKDLLRPLVTDAEWDRFQEIARRAGEESRG
jgi:hypothetical protein